jgi:hypothetical protein
VNRRFITLFLLLVAAPLVLPASAAERRASALARAWVASDGDGTQREVSVSGEGRRAVRGARVSASVAGGKGRASAVAQARGVDLFDGLVKARLVRAEATAPGSRSGRVEDLVIAGSERGDVTDTRRFRMGGYGRVVLLDRRGSGIVALSAELTKDYGDYPAGSVLSIAFASARASDAPKPKPKAKPKATKQQKPDRAKRARAKRRRAPELRALRTGHGYVFPVYGEHRFSDDYGAPRQDTGAHEGNDVFAKWGTPVVAVADGRLYRVGTRKVPGNRLWLRAKGGDTFFYAHLSAFAHDARNGAEVKAGDVVGFVGSTGDAEQTPPHLHFEIHPRDGDPVNPYPFLRAWDERRDVPGAAWLTQYGKDPGARPGALVVVRDYLER